MRALIHLKPLNLMLKTILIIKSKTVINMKKTFVNFREFKAFIEGKKVGIETKQPLTQSGCLWVVVDNTDLLKWLSLINPYNFVVNYYENVETVYLLSYQID